MTATVDSRSLLNADAAFRAACDARPEPGPLLDREPMDVANTFEAVREAVELMGGTKEERRDAA